LRPTPCWWSLALTLVLLALVQVPAGAGGAVAAPVRYLQQKPPHAKRGGGPARNHVKHRQCSQRSRGEAIPSCGVAPDPAQRRRPSLTQRRASLELTAMRTRTAIAVFINTRKLTSATALRLTSCVTASTVHTTMRAIRAQA
jgi:hypothetical protein